MDYNAKIKKLLSLAESPNEHEARAAMLKARQLMAEHKLQAPDAGPAQEVESREAGVTCSKRRDPWILSLAAAIAKSCGCEFYIAHEKGKQTFTPTFLGYASDLDACTAIFPYALSCIQEHNALVKRAAKAKGLRAAPLCNSYGYGFVHGLKEAYKKQDAEKGWGLVLATPKAVSDAVTQMTSDTVRTALKKPGFSEREYAKGFVHGKAFRPQEQLKDSQREGKAV